MEVIVKSALRLRQVESVVMAYLLCIELTWRQNVIKRICIACSRHNCM